MAVAVVVAKASAKPVAKAKAQRVHHATALHLRAAMAHKVARVLKAKAHPALTVKATLDVKVHARVAVLKSNAATRVLTTGAMAKAAPHHAVHALKAEAQVAALKEAKAIRTGMSAAVTTATSCRATSTRSKPLNLRAWICPTASLCAPAVNLIRPAPA